MNERTHKTWYVHTREYYSVTRENAVRIPASVCVHAEHTLLPERSQTSRSPNCDSTYVRDPELENPKTQGRGGENGKQPLSG